MSGSGDGLPPRKARQRAVTHHVSADSDLPSLRPPSSTLRRLSSSYDEAGREAIRVAVRMRPLTDAERQRGQDISVWRCDGDEVFQDLEATERAAAVATARAAEAESAHHPPPSASDRGLLRRATVSYSQPHRYPFDRVFGPNTTNEQVFDSVSRPIVQNVMEGFNGCIFVYGQTSSGKTWTMKGNPEQPGIIPQSINEIFHRIEATPEREYLLRVSYCEIYNEVVNDLLDPNNQNLQIYDDLHKGITVVGLTEEIVSTQRQVFDLIAQGELRRHVGSTNVNEYSSRSHTIFKVVCESREAGDSDGTVLVSSLYLIDLAGSERLYYSGSTGVRQKEGAYINKSLLTLGTVISRLSEMAAHPSRHDHVPFRDSKLTRILQPSLGGNSKTCIICTATPAPMHADETHSTLKFARRAKMIKNKASKNEIADDKALLKKYSIELERLKKQLADGGGSSERVHELEAKYGQVNAENEDLRQNLEATAKEREELEKLLKSQKEDSARLQAKMKEFSKLILVSSGKDTADTDLAEKAEKELYNLPQVLGALQRKVEMLQADNDQLKSSTDREIAMVRRDLTKQTEKVKKLKVQLEEERQESAHIHERNDKLQQQVSAVVSEVEVAKEKADMQVQEMRDRIEVLNAEKASMESDLTRLQEQETSYAGVRQALQERLDIAERKVDSLEQDLVQTRTDCADQLEAALNNMTTAVAENDSLHAQITKLSSDKEAEIAQLKQQIQHLTEEQATLKHDLATSKTLAAKLEDKLTHKTQELDRSVHTHEEKVASLQEALNEQTANVEEAQRVHHDLKAQLQGKVQELAQTREEHQVEVEALTTSHSSALKESNDQLSHVQSEGASMKNTIASLQSDISRMEREREKLEDQHSTKVASLQSEMEAAQLSRQQLSEQLIATETRLNAEIDTLKSDLEQAHSQAEASSKADQEHSQRFESEKTQMAAEIKTLQEDVTKASATIGALNTQLDTQNTSMEAECALRKSLEGQVTSLTSDLAHAQETIDIQGKEARDLAVQLAASQDSLTTTATTLEDTKTELLSTTSALTVMTQEREKLQLQLEKLQEQLEATSNAVDSVTKERDDLVTHVQESRGRVDKLQSQLQDTEGSLQQTETQVADLQQQTADLSTQLDESNRMLGETKQQLAGNEEALRELKKALQAKDMETERLQQTLASEQETEQSLQSKVVGLQGELDSVRQSLADRESELAKSKEDSTSAAALSAATIQEQEKRITTLQETITQTQSEREEKEQQLSNRIADLESDLARAQSSMGQKEQESSERISVLETELETAQATLTQKDEELQELATVIQEARDTIASSQQMIDKKNAEIEAAHLSAMESENKADQAATTSALKIESLQAQLLSANHQLEEASSRVTTLQGELESLKGELTAMTAAHQASDDQCKDLLAQLTNEQSQSSKRDQEAEERINTLQAEADDNTARYTSQIAELEDRIASLAQGEEVERKTHHEVKAMLEAQVATLEESLHTATTTAAQNQEDLTRRLTQVEQEYAKFKADARVNEQNDETVLAGVQHELTEVQAALEASKSDRQRLDKALAASRLESQGFAEQLANAKSRVQELKDQAQQLDANMATIKSELDIKSQETNALTRALKLTEEERDKLTATLKSSKSKHSDTVAQLTEEVASVRKEVEVRDKMVADLTTRVRQVEMAMSEQVEEARVETDRLNEDAQSVRTELQSAESRISEITTQRDALQHQFDQQSQLLTSTRTQVAELLPTPVASGSDLSTVYSAIVKRLAHAEKENADLKQSLSARDDELKRARAIVEQQADHSKDDSDAAAKWERERSKLMAERDSALEAHHSEVRMKSILKSRHNQLLTKFKELEKENKSLQRQVDMGGGGGSGNGTSNTLGVSRPGSRAGSRDVSPLSRQTTGGSSASDPDTAALTQQARQLYIQKNELASLLSEEQRRTGTLQSRIEGLNQTIAVLRAEKSDLSIRLEKQIKHSRVQSESVARRTQSHDTLSPAAKQINEAINVLGRNAYTVGGRAASGAAGSGSVRRSPSRHSNE